MITYQFDCPGCGLVEYIGGEMSSPPQTRQCSVCKVPMFRYYGCNVFTFSPYMADMFPGPDVEITSKSQRDMLLDKHNLTHDSTRYVRKPEWKPVVDEVTLDDVREGISRGLHIPSDTGAEDFKDCGPPVEVPAVGTN